MEKVLQSIHSVLEEQKYFAAYNYNNPFYIGKITNFVQGTLEMKFLKQSSF